MKAEGAKLNTHIITVNGLVTYYEIQMLKKTKVDIKCTIDSYRETLSLTVDDVEILVKVSDIERIIKEARGETE